MNTLYLSQRLHQFCFLMSCFFFQLQDMHKNTQTLLRLMVIKQKYISAQAMMSEQKQLPKEWTAFLNSIIN